MVQRVVTTGDGTVQAQGLGDVRANGPLFQRSHALVREPFLFGFRTPQKPCQGSRTRALAVDPCVSRTLARKTCYLENGA